jgi:hypothetical protein
MSRRRWIIVSLATVLLVRAEVTLRQWEAPKACPRSSIGRWVMDDPVVDYADTKVIRTTRGGPVDTSGCPRARRGRSADFDRTAALAVPDPRFYCESQDALSWCWSSRPMRSAVRGDNEFRKETLGDLIKRWMNSELEPIK